MEKEKNLIVLTKNLFSKVNLKMGKEMEKEKNIMKKVN